MKRNIEDYQILCSKSTLDLQNTVKRFISDGWSPIGGMVVEEGKEADYTTYYQTMIKYKEE